MAYAQRTSRTTEKVIDTKLYYIGRRACWYTPRADKTKIARELGTIVTMIGKNARGKVVRLRRVYQGSSSGRADGKTLAMLIIMARRRLAGKPGLDAKEMEDAIRKLVAMRQRSRGFLAAGWLDGIKLLAPLADKAGAPQTGGDARVYGRAKGTAAPAWGAGAAVGIVRGSITNFAHTKKDEDGQALSRHASQALERAFSEETQSMMDYLEKKMVEDVLAFNEQQQ